MYIYGQYIFHGIYIADDDYIIGFKNIIDTCKYWRYVQKKIFSIFFFFVRWLAKGPWEYIRRGARVWRAPGATYSRLPLARARARIFSTERERTGFWLWCFSSSVAQQKKNSLFAWCVISTSTSKLSYQRVLNTFDDAVLQNLIFQLYIFAYNNTNQFMCVLVIALIDLFSLFWERELRRARTTYTQ